MKIKNNVKCLRILPSFYFITLAKVFFHLLTSLPFSYTPKLGTCIGMLLNRNVIKLNIFLFVWKSFYSPTTQRSTECLCTWSMQYVLLSFHIVLKFNHQSWQVPRDSVGRALYRKSGPSQDGYLVPGNLPFFCWFFSMFFLFVQFLSFPSLYVNQKLIWCVLVYTLFTSLHYTLTIGTSIEMLLNRNVIKSNNIFFEGNSS